MPAFPVRLPVEQIEVRGLSDEEQEIFTLVSAYCAKTIEAAAGSEEADLVSFAMQIVKKRMLSSRAALHQTVKNRLEALASRKLEEPPARSEVRELQADLPLAEAAAERTANRIPRAAVARDSRRRGAEKQQLKTIEKLLDRVTDRPDPKITALIFDLERDVLTVPGEKAIVFTDSRTSRASQYLPQPTALACRRSPLNLWTAASTGSGTKAISIASGPLTARSPRPMDSTPMTSPTSSPPFPSSPVSARNSTPFCKPGSANGLRSKPNSSLR